MCVSILNRKGATPASLLQVASADISSREKDGAEPHHLHMAWVLVAETKGDPRLQLHWQVD